MTYAAIDLGAESGRVVRGAFDGRRVELEVVHRFPNRPVALPDGLRWDLLSLFSEALEGLGRTGAVDGIGVDAWGVDYGLLDGAGRLLGLPFHYRDARTEGMIERAFARVPREELYRVAGIQTMPINTVFQLLADEGSPALAAAERIALVPDLMALWLMGEPANEVTAASTTGLLDARTGRWARELIARLGLPPRPFAGDPVEPGTRIGAHDGVPVYAVAGHDTASAFVATPVATPGAAILSSGTWSLLGVELPAPVLDARAAAANLTNERGVEGTIRLLRNVMGLWLLQECRRHWATYDYDELCEMAARERPDVPLFDPDGDEFLAPGDMPGRIDATCRRLGQRAPAGPGATVRSLLVSLACKYRFVLERVQEVTGRRVDCIHVIGGGARNRLLCQLTADITGLPVMAGPIEATALGNVLVQALGAGRLTSLAEMRQVAAASAKPERVEPRGSGDTDYERFLAVTGLAAQRAEETVA
jgi:rhamnulokinase